MSSGDAEKNQDDRVLPTVRSMIDKFNQIHQDPGNSPSKSSKHHLDSKEKPAPSLPVPRPSSAMKEDQFQIQSSRSAIRVQSVMNENYCETVRSGDSDDRIVASEDIRADDLNSSIGDDSVFSANTEYGSAFKPPRLLPEPEVGISLNQNRSWITKENRYNPVRTLDSDMSFSRLDDMNSSIGDDSVFSAVTEVGSAFKSPDVRPEFIPTVSEPPPKIDFVRPAKSKEVFVFPPVSTSVSASKSHDILPSSSKAALIPLPVSNGTSAWKSVLIKRLGEVLTFLHEVDVLEVGNDAASNTKLPAEVAKFLHLEFNVRVSQKKVVNLAAPEKPVRSMSASSVEMDLCPMGISHLTLSLLKYLFKYTDTPVTKPWFDRLLNDPHGPEMHELYAHLETAGVRQNLETLYEERRHGRLNFCSSVAMHVKARKLRQKIMHPRVYRKRKALWHLVLDDRMSRVSSAGGKNTEDESW